MVFSSYRKKLIVIFIIIAIIPIIFINLTLNFKVKKQIINEGIEVKKELIHNECDKIDIWLKEKEETLKSISANYPNIKDMIGSSYDFMRVNGYLSAQKIQSLSIKSIFITLNDGRHYNSYFKTVHGDTRTREWYKNTYSSKKLVWTQPYKDWLTGDIVITVSMPLYEKNGKIAGVLGANFDFNDLTSKIEKIKIDDNASTLLVDSTGNILKAFSSEKINFNDLTNVYTKETHDYIDNILNKDTGHIDFNIYKEYFAVYSTIPTMGWKIVSIIQRDYFFQSLTGVNRYILYTLIGTLVFVVILALILARNFSVPLEKLKKGALEIQKGNFNYRLPEYKNEFGQVAKAFNDMSFEIKQSHDKLETQTQELILNNRQLQEMNMELEASYEQFQAATLQLNDSEKRYKTLIENMYDLVWMIDNEGKIIFINDMVESMLKYKKEEIIGKEIYKLRSIWSYSEEVDDILLELKKKDYKNIEAIFKSRDGEDTILEINTKRIFENGQFIGVQGVGRNITERKNMEREIIQRNIELTTVNKISINLNATMDLTKLLQYVVEDIEKLMDMPVCTIRLLHNNKLKLLAKAGELVDAVLNKSIQLDEAIISEGLKNYEIERFNQFLEESVRKFNEEIKALGEVRYISIVPLKARGTILGILSVFTKEKLSASNFNILSSVSNQCAMIIENIKLYQGLKDNYMKTIETLAAAVEAKDKYTEGHSLRVSKYGYLIAKHLSLSKEDCEDIKIAGILHDIGKIGISDNILTKPGKLSEDEYKEIIRHPIIGSKILGNVGLTKNIMNAIKYHHKRYDLEGYPLNEDVDELPSEASIIGVADAFDAMTSNRAYRSSMSIEKAIDELIRNKGSQFNPFIVDAFVNIYQNTPWTIEDIMGN